MNIYECPKTIYKYLDYEGIKKTLTGRSFKLSRPSDFNDPLDLYIQEAFGVDQIYFLKDLQKEFSAFVSGDIDYRLLPDNPLKYGIILINQALRTASPSSIEMIKNEMVGGSIDDFFDVPRLEEVTREALEFVSKRFKDEGVFCSTVDNKNFLMWAHYADGHKGAVIEFTPNVEQDSVFLASRPVQYSKIRPLLYRSAKDMIEHSFTMTIDQSVAKIVDGLIFTKSEEWRYEQEYRLSIPDMVPEGENFSTLRFDFTELSSIFFGCRMPTDQKQELAHFARCINPNTLLFECVLSRREYEIHFKEYDID